MGGSSNIIVVGGGQNLASAPTIGTATLVNKNTVRVSYTASVSNGGAYIVGYTAVSTPGNFVGFASGSDDVIVTGLTPGVGYTFTVYAVNAAGNSPRSQPSNSVIPVGVPDAPIMGTATVTGTTTATVTYTAPNGNGGSTITSYTAVSNPDSVTGTVTQAGSGTISITGLTSGSTYTFTVYATNFYGNGPSSTASNSIIALAPPGAPTMGAATATGLTSVGVSYTAPAYSGSSSIVSYTAVASPGGITSTLNQSGSGTITFVGLTQGTAYTFTVYATNSTNNSSNSASSNSVTLAVLDANFATVPMLLETRSALTRTTAAVVDSSVSAAGYTRTGNPSTGSISPYQTDGYWSNYFPSTGADYLQVPAGTAFAPGTGDFTVECWVYPTSFDATNGNFVWAQSVSGTNYFIFSFTSTTAGFTATASGSGTAILGPTTSIPANSWNHIAVIRASGIVRVFVNGVSGTATSNTTDLSNTSYVPTIGRYTHSAAAGIWSGYISNLRYVKGVAVYTGNFTPPTGPLSYIQSAGTNIAAITGTATSLLTCQSNRFIDNSKANSGAGFTITVNGTPQITAYSYPSGFAAPASSIGALFLNGTSEYLTNASTSAGAFGSNNFTVEAWVYPTVAVSANLNTIASANTGSTNTGWQLYYTNTGIGVRSNTTNYITTLGTTTIPPTFAWSHIAWTRNGTTYYVYLNGKQVGTSTTLGTWTDTYVTIGVFASNIAGTAFPGYIANLRFVNNTAVYTAGTTGNQIFTPPSGFLAQTGGTYPSTTNVNVSITAANTTLLLNFADANYTSVTDTAQNNTFVDSGSYGWVTTRTGSPTQGSFSPFWPNGYWSNYFNGSSGLSTASTTALVLNIGAPPTFTIEFWAFVTASSNCIVIDKGSQASVSVPNYRVAIDTNVFNFLWGPGTGSGETTYSATGYTIPNGTWTHCAVVANNAALTMYINGILRYSGGTLASHSDNGKAVYIGSRFNADLWYSGHISNLRVVKGVAVYTGAFTPPTGPLSYIQSAGTNIAAITGTATSLLTCQSNRFRDNTTNAFTITTVGTPQANAFQPFAQPITYSPTVYNGSGYFSGTGDWIQNTNVYVFDLSNATTSFTIEAWVYNTSLAAIRGIMGARTNAATEGWCLYINTDGTFYTGSIIVGNAYTNRQLNTTVIPANTWAHVALVKDVAGYTGYVNGVAGTKIALTGGLDYKPAQALTIGALASGGELPFTGYITNVRIVKGLAVYPANFTPSLEPLPVINPTSILHNFSNAAIYDAAGQNNAVTVSSAQSSITQYKWAPTSMKFNGTSDYLTMLLTPSIQFGTSDFTVECWSYLISRVSTQPCIFNNYNSYTTGSLALFAGHGSATTTQYQVAINGGSFPSTAIQGGTIVYNSWVHLAVVRSNGIITLYVNGAIIGTSYSAVALNGVGSLFYVGTAGDTPTTAYLNGYIQDFRVSRLARYATDPTVPTAAISTITNTVLLLKSDTATDGAQNNTFLDSSSNNFTITRNGTVTQGSFTPYWPNGQWSNYFNGSTDYLTVPANVAFNIGTGDFTVEGWIYTSGATVRAIFSFANNNVFYLNASGIPYYGIYLVSDTAIGSTAITSNAWTHVAFVRSGTTLTCYFNGVSVGSITTASSIGDSVTSNYVGFHRAGNYFSGYISNLRIVKGTAVYTAAFTPPTTPLTAITNTSLLTCQSNRFRDNSTNNFAITVNGTPLVQAFQPFSPPVAYTAAAYGGSGYFNGSTTDYLSVPGTGIGLSGQSFTIEGWFYPTAYGKTGYTGPGPAYIFTTTSTSSASGGGFGFQFMLGGVANTSFTVISLYANNGVLDSSISYSFQINNWYHIALTKNVPTNTFTVYVNGTSIGIVVNSTTWTDNSPYAIGRNNQSTYERPFTGYISNFRMVIGTVVYTGNFTPPTAPLSATQSAGTNIASITSTTALLINFTNAGIYDAAVQNNSITVGSAQASTAITAKWGTTSIKFNGTTDYLSPPSNPAFAFGTGDFTLECWIYATAASDMAIYEGRASGSGTTGFTLTAFSTSIIRVYTGAAALISSAGTTYLNLWTHVAVVRVSGTTALYINGQFAGAASGMGNLTDTTPVIGGGRYLATTAVTSFFTGYIQDFKITRGIVRTITTPIAALPTSGSLIYNDTVEYLVVAGGGGGGYSYAGGGGAGGLLSGTVSYTASIGSVYTVTVGAGGVGAVSTVARGSSGSSSVFSTVSTVGGGGGGSWTGTSSYPNGTGQEIGGTGGSGGGGSSKVATTAAGTVGQGNAGGAGSSNNSSFDYGGGGGGAGTAGGANAAGAGAYSAVTGTTVAYAGGGGSSGTSASNGGIGGGGNGNTGGAGVAGTTNTGGGGGGGNSVSGGPGGSGTVIIAFSNTNSAISYVTSGLTYTVASTRAGYRVYRFTAGTGNIGFGTLAVPDAPTIGTAVATGGTTATVAYTAPTNNGGNAITQYTAKAYLYPDGTDTGITGTLNQATAGTITVSGLSLNTAYTFTVYATNGVGNSTNSSASNSITTWTYPGAPTIGSAASIGSTSATVTYTAPASNGGTPIISYTATSTPGSITGTLSQAGSGTITVTGLSTGVPYTFKVYATNAVGISTLSGASSPSITNLAIPDAPGIGTATTAGTTSATVSYTAPTNNGGFAITRYTAKAYLYPAGTDTGITGILSQATSGTITVSGLTTGLTYTFTVYATNSTGNSVNSAASNSITTLTVPGAPTNVSAYPVGSGQIAVAFSAPANNGGATITSYTATSSPGSITGTGSSSPITVSGLTDGTAYTFTVVARNSVGNSTASTASNSVANGDANFSSVGLLLKTKPTNGINNNNYVDSSSNGIAITRVGAPTGTLFNPYGLGFGSAGGSLFLNGGRLTTAGNTVFNLSATDFTIECWIYMTANPSTYNRFITVGPNAALSSLSFNVDTAGVFSVSQPKSPDGKGAGGNTISLNTWTHLSFVYTVSNLTGTVYVNGSQYAQTTSWTYSASTTNYFYVGYDTTGTVNGTFNGYITDVRFVRGAVVPTSAPTAPLTAVANTAYLLNFNNQTSVGIYDASARSLTSGSPVVTLGTAQSSTDTAVWSPTSMVFSSGGLSYLTMPLTTDLQFGTGDFTVEFWNYMVSRDKLYPCIFNNYNSYTTGSLALFAGHNSATTTQYQVAINGGAFPSTAVQSGTSGAIIYNTWTHLAVVRSGGVISLYLNGVRVGNQITSSAALNGVGSNFYIGASGDNLANSYINGYIQDFRVTKGLARYTSTPFAPPSRAFSTVAAAAGIPNAPTVGSATAVTPTSAVVSYIMPDSDGGSTITGYTAVSSPGGITATLSQATSGTITVTGLNPSTAYTFTVYATNAYGNGQSSSASNSITTAAASAPFFSYLVVAGGGGGGYNASGGGGAGGLLTGNVAYTTGVTYTVSVGPGGVGQTGTVASTNGTDSSISGTGITTITAVGGGKASTTGPSSGGSGGGGSPTNAGSQNAVSTGGAGTASQGNDGGYATVTYPNIGAGGGGGAGAVGSSNATAHRGGEPGGIGAVSYLITSAIATSRAVGQVSNGLVYFAGGGAGGGYCGSTISPIAGGLGGGGGGGESLPGTAGTANTGGGGAGGAQQCGNIPKDGAAGGSGVVIITSPYTAASVTGSVYTDTMGSNKVYTFIGSGTIRF